MMESIKTTDGSTTHPGTPMPDLLEFSDSDLRVRDVMTESIVSAACGEVLLSVARRMANQNVSCVVVVSGPAVVGILTERDMLHGVAGGRQDFARATVAERMSSPVATVGPDASLLEAGVLMESSRIKRLPVVDAGQLLGIVTQTDITRGLISLSPLRKIAAFMSTDVATVSSAATVAEAARLMTARNVSCVVAMHRDEAAGILTEKDILRRIVALHKDPTACLVVEVTSFPVLTTPPTHSVMSASRIMHDRHVHRFVVGTTSEVRGIVSQTDILAAIRTTLEEARKERLRHRSEMTGLADSIARSLSEIRDRVTPRLPDSAQTPSAGTADHAGAPYGGPSGASSVQRPKFLEDPALQRFADLVCKCQANLERHTGKL